MALCPPATTLPLHRLCFAVAELCYDNLTTTAPVRLTVALNVPRGTSHVQDPTTGAVVNSGYVYNIVEPIGSDGCMITCQLPANQSTDVNKMLHPGGTSYRIQLIQGTQSIGLWDNFILDAEAAAAATTNTVDGNICIPFTSLVPPLPTIPASNPFLAAVHAAETVTTLTSAAGVLTYDNEATTAPVTIRMVSADAGNALTVGSDGGLYLSVASVNTGIEVGHGSVLPANNATFELFELEASPILPDGLYRWNNATNVWVQI